MLVTCQNVPGSPSGSAYRWGKRSRVAGEGEPGPGAEATRVPLIMPTLLCACARGAVIVNPLSGAFVPAPTLGDEAGVGLARCPWS